MRTIDSLRKQLHGQCIMKLTPLLSFCRNPDAPGQLFEYVYSHGQDTDDDSIDDVWAPNNVHIYLPEDAHPAHGIIRTVVKDSNDPEELVYYVDR